MRLSTTLLRPLSLLTLTVGLAACATSLPTPRPDQAFIDLQGETPSTLLAERVDGRPVSDGRYFLVPAGRHRLQMELFEEGDQRIQDSEDDCRLELDYDHFVAGQRYQVSQSSLGEDLHAELRDNHGRVLAQTDQFDCMPG